jgi:uncharacterized MAPEG superfamily protein
MTTDLTYLAYTAILTGSLWIPYVISQVVTNGFLTPANAVEVFGPFAALVLVAHTAGKASESTAFWTMFFFWSRLAHAVVYLLGLPYIRTVVFTAGWVAVVALFWDVMH